MVKFTTSFASECVVIPSGSNITTPDGVAVMIQPIITGKCMTSNQDGITNSIQYNCSGSTAEELKYNKSDSCKGKPSEIYQISVNGSCTTMECFAYDFYEYDNLDCKDKPYVNRTNVYKYWLPDICVYYQNETCIDGEPNWESYAPQNPPCGGLPTTVTKTGQCVRYHQGGNSYFINVTDNPCGTR